MKAFKRTLFVTLGLVACTQAGEASKQIDAILAKDWQQIGLKPNPPASDETFVRRVHLDIIGRIPTMQETQAFLKSTDKDKRAKLIDALLASDGFHQHMFHFWADLLRIQSRANGGQGDMTSKPYLEHVKRRIRENMPYDAFVRELLTAQGKVWDNPAIGYYMRDLGMPLDNLANTTPNILYELVLGGVLSSTLVPLFVRSLDDPDDDTASVLTTVSSTDTTPGVTASASSSATSRGSSTRGSPSASSGGWSASASPGASATA